MLRCRQLPTISRIVARTALGTLTASCAAVCAPIGLFGKQGRSCGSIKNGVCAWLVNALRDCSLVTSARNTGNNAMNVRMSRVLLIALFVFEIGALVGSVPDAEAQTSEQFGLEWPGNGAVRRMLYWADPFPIYDATYVFRVYPRSKAGFSNPRYYTTFFWGNNGTFIWDGGNANTYYGAHPYPIPAPDGPGQWEISVYSNDFVTGNEVQWNRWYTQVFRAWRVSASETRHEFYWDWPDTSKVITKTIVDPNWANRNPPKPAILMGQAPNLNGASWGGYPGWEEFNGVIRGIQIYSGLLSLGDLQSEIAAPKSTTAGQNFIWYLNLDPRPSDVTDKRGIGTAHNPSWEGTTALEWSAQGGSSPTPPAVSGVSATNITTSAATIRWTTNEPADGRVEYGTTTAYGQTTTVSTALVTSHAVSLSGLVLGTTYHYRVQSRDAEGNATTSADFTFSTLAAADTAPPVISGVGATNLTSSGAVIQWTTNEAATSQVEYGTTTAYGQTTTVDASLVTSHAVSLSGLVAGTTYHYRVRSADPAANAAASADFAFATAAAADTTPPAISAIAATNITASGATINWTTSEPSTSQVDYGSTSAYGQSTAFNSALVTAHSVTLSGLSASTAYHFRVRSRDATGNSASSSDWTLTTSAQGSTTASALAAYGFNEALGSTTADASGHGFNGRLVNLPVWTSGHSGNAVLFDGLNDKISLPSTLDVSQLPFTLEAWIMPSSASRGDWRAIFSKRNSYSSSEMRFDVGLSNGSGKIYLTTAQSFVKFWYAPPLNTWTHVAIVAQSSGTRLYVNGILKQTLAPITLGNAPTAFVTIGNTGDDDDPFAGVIDDLRLYDRALSASEIQTDMTSGLF
jgi:hypothetical protein